MEFAYGPVATPHSAPALRASAVWSDPLSPKVIPVVVLLMPLTQVK